MADFFLLSTFCFWSNVNYSYEKNHIAKISIAVYWFIELKIQRLGNNLHKQVNRSNWDFCWSKKTHTHTCKLFYFAVVARKQRIFAEFSCLQFRKNLFLLVHWNSVFISIVTFHVQRKKKLRKFKIKKFQF